MRKKPLLTVAIPTYNRSKTLEKIIKLFQKEGADFFILISDDNSLDNTEQMVKSYQKKMPHLFYNKNNSNLGYSGNVCKVYELARTKYVWFLCDDDMPLPGAIKSITEVINKYEPVVAVFNTVWTDSFGRKKVAGVTKDIVYTNINDLETYNSLMRLTFLSIVIVEKRISTPITKEAIYKDNIFFQLSLSLLLLSDSFRFCEIAFPIVERNVGYKYGEFFKFNLVDHLKAIMLVNHKFDNKKFIKWSIEHLPIMLQLYLSQKIGLFTYNGRPTKNTIRMIVKFYKFYSVFIFSFVVLYYLIPSIIIRYLYLMILWKFHGLENGGRVYKANINRAIRDKRKTGFTTYR